MNTYPTFESYKVVQSVINYELSSRSPLLLYCWAHCTFLLRFWMKKNHEMLSIHELSIMNWLSAEFCDQRKLKVSLYYDFRWCKWYFLLPYGTQRKFFREVIIPCRKHSQGHPSFYLHIGMQSNNLKYLTVIVILFWDDLLQIFHRLQDAVYSKSGYFGEFHFIFAMMGKPLNTIPSNYFACICYYD